MKERGRKKKQAQITFRQSLDKNCLCCYELLNGYSIATCIKLLWLVLLVFWRFSFRWNINLFNALLLYERFQSQSHVRELNSYYVDTQYRDDAGPSLRSPWPTPVAMVTTPVAMSQRPTCAVHGLLAYDAKHCQH